MTAITGKRPRIFWYEVAKKWAIRVSPLPEPTKSRLFLNNLRQLCAAVFHQQAQAWLIPEAHLEKAKDLVEKYYQHYEFVDKIHPRQDSTSLPHPELYATFCKLVGWRRKTLPSHAEAKALYRQAAARLHPDVGGSADSMALLNDAWRAIKDKLF